MFHVQVQAQQSLNLQVNQNEAIVHKTRCLPTEIFHPLTNGTYTYMMDSIGPLQTLKDSDESKWGILLLKAC